MGFRGPSFDPLTLSGSWFWGPSQSLLGLGFPTYHLPSRLRVQRLGSKIPASFRNQVNGYKCLSYS